MTGLARDRKRSQRDGARDLLSLRIGALLVLIIAFVLSLITFLNYSNYRKTITELNQSRYLVVAKDLRQVIDLGLNAGLQPSENTQLKAIMANIIRKHDGIRYISVIDETNGDITLGMAGDTARQAWRAWFPKTEASHVWQTKESDNYQIGVPFSNNFKLKIGAVVVGYDKVVIEHAVRAMGEKLIVDASATLLVFAVITLAGVHLLSRKYSRKIDHVAAVIDSALTAEHPAHLEEQWLDAETGAAIKEFVMTAHGVANRLAEMERRMTPNDPPHIPPHNRPLEAS